MKNKQPLIEKNITVRVNGKTITAKANTLLSEIIGMEKPCGGHGKCGKCKVRARGALSSPCETEEKLLFADELARGVRLSCMTYAIGDCEVESLQTMQNGQILTQGDVSEAEVKPDFSKYGVCVDIGTTTLAARLYDSKGNLLAEDARLNPQVSWGADVISRVEAALKGEGGALATAIRKELDVIFSRLAELARIDAKDIDGVTVTGNTVMLSLLAKESVEPFSHAPFAVKRLFGETLTAEELDLKRLSKETSVYLAPCISAFVGADTVCAMLSTALCKENSAMLVDMGTNGEMALWHNGKLTVCSTAAGPAFEGVGISMGMRGEVGAIDRVTIVNGAPYAHTIGNQPPVGICGSGLIDAVACMLDLEILEKGGYLEEDPFVIEAPVSLIQEDVWMFQLAKGAVCAGLEALMETQGIDPADIQSLFVAGGFGNYLNPHRAARIGLFPRVLASKTKAVGNAALSGAALLLLNADMRNKAKAIAENATTLELASNSVFVERYLSGMLLGEI